MLRSLLALSAGLLLTGATALRAQGIEFFAGSYEEALAEAEATGKLVFIDAYAVWCGPCKRMSNEVFPRADVGEFYNRHFVNLKLDMERGAGKEFQRIYPVSSYPTLLYLDAAGELVQRIVGAQDGDNLIQQGKRALRRADDTDALAQRYRDGERDAAFIAEYVRALNAAGEPALAIANDFLRQRTDHDDPDVQAVVFAAATQADSRIFDLLIERRGALEAAYGAAAVADRIEAACRATALKGIAYDSDPLVADAKATIDAHLPSRARAFEATIDLAVAKKRDDPGMAYKAARRVVTAEGNSAAANHAMAVELRRYFPDAPKAMGLAARMAGTAAKVEPNFDHLFTYAELLAAEGKTRKALAQVEMALEGLGADDDPRREAMARELIERLGS